LDFHAKIQKINVFNSTTGVLDNVDGFHLLYSQDISYFHFQI
jgi:hypothetical protein